MTKGEEMIKNTSKIKEENWLKRKEKWLVILGIILHSIYMLSIFDIYLVTPIVHGIEPVTPRFNAPAKRLVLFIADGLRADKFYEPDEKGNWRSPFLRGIIGKEGRWGVSRARAPTESRPCHVALLAGFYEDPSAVTKGWKANPVEYDSVFNQSKHIIAFGSPSVVPIFCRTLPHCTWKTFPYGLEDSTNDASIVDEWVLNEFESLLIRSEKDEKLKEILQQDDLIIFLHMDGCDSNGANHRPYGKIYLDNVNVVDRIVKKVYNLIQSYYKDDSTAYIFTADHGMGDRGGHGDGDPTMTDTPLVAWGAGVSRSSNDVRFVDENSHHTPTPLEWGLNGTERVDVHQADLAPLMSTLLGLPCPVNSVGTLPLGFVNFDKGKEVEAVLANAKQILNQFLRKSQLKQSRSLNFKPFKPLANYFSLLDRIETLISLQDYEVALKLSENLRSLALEGVYYIQTYDWFMLMSVITLGYIGWIIYVFLHVLESYTSLSLKISIKEEGVYTNGWKVYLCGCTLTGLVSFLLWLEHSPPLYHAYTAMTIFMWTLIFNEYHVLKSVFRDLCGKDRYFIMKLVGIFIVSVFIFELLVKSFLERKVYTWCFLVMGVSFGIYLYRCIPWKSGIPIYSWGAFWFLAVFTLMPARIPDNTPLVIVSGFIIVIIGGAAIFMDLCYTDCKYWSGLVNHEKKRATFPFLFLMQALLVILSSVMVSISTSHTTQKPEWLVIYQRIIWSITGFSTILPLFSNPVLLSRLNSIFLGFAPAFLLLSIGYEAVFYGALALALVAWLFFEYTCLHISSTEVDGVEENNIVARGDRFLQLSDMRILLIFMVFFSVSFFGTNSLASIATFRISSAYRFIKTFDPVLMSALYVIKLVIPIILVSCVFSAITKLLRLPLLGCFFLVVSCSDVMTIHFFFLVKNTGSWMEIGNSMGHLGLMNAQLPFILLLFLISSIYTKDIQYRAVQNSSKVM